ncbi:MAG: hypothetical protein ACR2P9_01865 [Gammaproteobacteria bacterium]
MSNCRNLFAAFCVCSTVWLVSCQSGNTDQVCNKSCLSDITEQYLEAKARGNTAALPLADNLRVTHNSQPVTVGTGDSWQPEITIENRHTFLDPVTRTAIFFGTIAGKVEENRIWWHYVLRLSVDANGDIAEIEEQSAQTGFQTADKVETPFKEAVIFNAVLPEDERVSATELIRAADGYWDGVTTGEGEDILFTPGCQRTEFGAYTTNNPFTHDARGTTVFVPQPRTGRSCRKFFDAPKFRWTVDNRRYYVVDKARGIVVGIAQFKKFGGDGHKGLILFEAFKIINGRIEFLWAPGFTWGLEESGWPDWERTQ